MPKVIFAQNGTRLIQCPACREAHYIDDRWTFNGNVNEPTFTPSILVTGGGEMPVDDLDYRGADTLRSHAKTVCHSRITDGQIEFLTDCTHEFAVQTVELEDWDD